MKKTYAILTILGLVSLSAQAQDYAPFTPGRTPYFQAGDSVYSLRITNAYVQGNDSVFEFNPRLVPLAIPISALGCYGQTTVEAARNTNNIFGAKMVKSAGWLFRFVLANGNEYLVKPKAAIGTTWVFSQEMQLSATLAARSVGLVQGMPDSVSTVLLSNGDSILLSKNYGLVSARSFVSYTNTAANAQPVWLVRLPEAGIGSGIDHAYPIFNFQPGDKFLYEGQHKLGFPPCYNYLATTEVLSRNESQDSIWYTLRNQRLITAVPGAPLSACNIQPGTHLLPPEHPRFTSRSA